MTRVLVIGASSGIGLETVRSGLDEGLEIRGMARSADAMEVTHARFEPFAGDATDLASVIQALDGVDAMIQTLGVKIRPRTVLRSVSLFSTATGVLVSAMEEAGIRRLITVTGFGAGNSRSKISLLEALPFHTMLASVYADKDLQEDRIRASNLDWTIVRPGILTGGPRTGRYRVLISPGSWHNGLIARADVADLLIAALERPDLIAQAPVVVY